MASYSAKTKAEVLPGIHKVPGTRGANVFLIDDAAALTLIDTGVPGNAGAVLRYIRLLGRHPADLKRIILTHGHPDHTGSAKDLRGITGAAVIAHAADTWMAPGGQAWSQQTGVPWSLQPSPWRSAVDIQIGDKELLPVRGGLRVVSAPGHTPGSICLLLEREGVLFIGDLLSHRGDYLARSIPFPGTDLKQYHASLASLAQQEFDTILFGHGDVLHGAGNKVVAEAARWYIDAPGWQRPLQAIPSALRLGIQVNYRHT